MLGLGDRGLTPIALGRAANVQVRSTCYIIITCYYCNNSRAARARALDWSAVAACWAEAGFRVKQAIFTHFYVIITSLLPVITVMMALLLHIFASLLRHYNVLNHYYLLHHYYLLLLL